MGASHLQKTWNHIRHVQDLAWEMGNELIRQDKENLGRSLIHNSLSHDKSKFVGIEWEHLVRGDELLNECIRHHNQTNPHHPEYWGGIQNMPDVYLAEMICDWVARSFELGTSVRDWIDKNASEKFGYNLNDEIYKKIKYFLDLIVEKPFI